MKIGKWIFHLSVALVFTACSYEANEAEMVKETPEALQHVDNMLQKFTSSPQMLSASGKKISKVTGARGTIIHVNPDKLETVDGTPIGDKIDVALLEISDQVNMMLNSVTTTTADKPLEVGGAFFIKMWSKGKVLKLKEGEGLEVEYPIWVGPKMDFFYGKKDSLGQIGWEKSEISLVEKVIQNPEKPVSPENSKKVEEISKDEYDSYLLALQNYKKKQKQIVDSRKTFALVEIKKLGWTSAANSSFADGANLLDISLKVTKDEGLSRVRFYAIVKGINSVVSANYRSSGDGVVMFKNIPKGKETVIIGVGAREEQAFIYVQEVIGKAGLGLEAQLMPASPEELRRAISRAS